MTKIKSPVCDCDYNIMKQLVKKLEFLWRVDGYIKDAKNCRHKECERVLKEIKKDEIKHAEMLKELIVKKAKKATL